MKRILPLLLALVAGLASAQGSHHSHQHSFGDAEKWAKEFDDPARDEWQKPAEVIKALALAPDAKVADIGAGTGYFSVRLARAVPKGKVYAVDAEADMVRYLGERAKKEGLANLVPLKGDAETPNLPEAVDLVLIVDTAHHIEKRRAYFHRLRGSLVPGARIAVIDFTPESKIGPPPAGRIATSKLHAELSEAGYRLVATHAFLPNQFFVVYQAPLR